MATEDNGSIPTITPPLTEDAVFNLDLDLEHMRQTLNDARSKLQHLEDMNKEHHVAVQNNMKELLSDTKVLTKYSLTASLDGGIAQDFSQKRLMNGFIREVKEFTKDFQRTSEYCAQFTIGSGEKEAFQALVQEVTDLNSLVKDIVELRDDQEDSIERNIEEAASHVFAGYEGIKMGVVIRRKRRRFIAIIIGVVVGVVIVVVLVSLAIIITSVCVSTEQCSK